jgi:pilus assembly protein CpaB
MRGNNILILVVAIALGGVAAFLARNSLGSRQAQTAANRTIVVAANALPFGTQLTEKNVKVIPWAAETLPVGTFLSTQALFEGGHRTALSMIAQDEPILNSKITGPGQRASLSTLIDKDKRAITIRVDDVRGVAGFILPNDHVDVVLNHATSTNSKKQAVSDILLQDVKVIAVDQIASERKDHPTVAKAVTLEVTPYQAQKISLATTIGHLSLILRRAGDSQIIHDRRVSQIDLTQHRYTVAEATAPRPVVNKVPPEPTPKMSDPSSLSTVSIVRGIEKRQEYQVIQEKR